MAETNLFLEKCLTELQHCPELKKYEQYEVFHAVIAKEVNLSISFIKNLLVILNRDLREPTKYTNGVLSVLIIVLKKIQSKNEVERFELKTVLERSTYSTIYQLTKALGLTKNLAYQAILAYPAEVFIDFIVDNSNALYTLISQPLKAKCGAAAFNWETFKKEEELEIEALIFELIKKILKYLPNDVKKQFVSRGLDIWFSNVLPYTISLMVYNLLSVRPVYTEVLDLLVKELATIDYKSNKEWKKIVECIVNTSGYQALMLKSLKSGSDNWYKIWCVLIRLLISRTVTKDSPINSLLPVVECAFKGNTKDRCRAFLCWKTLADHFAGDKNAEKRMNFLMIPLESNNAKVEEVILAKFSCWWHIIKCYRSKINSSNNGLLLKFLFFSFGSNASSAYDKVKKMAAQAMLDIVGHDSDCLGCNDPDFPRMTSPILDIAVLTYHLSDWQNHFKSTYYVLCTNQDRMAAQKQITCLWKSIFSLLSTMTKNHIRRDLTFELLKTSLEVLMSYEEDSVFITNALCKTFLNEGNCKVHTLIACSDNDITSEPLNILIHCFLHQNFTKHLLVDGQPSQEIKLIVQLAFKSYKNDDFTEWFLSLLSKRDLIFWIEVCELACEQGISTDTCFELLKWPMVNNAYINNFSQAIGTWKKVYKVSRTMFPEEIFDKDLSELLLSSKISTSFSIAAILIICTHSMTEDYLEKIIKLISNDDNSVRDLVHKIFPTIKDFFDDTTQELKIATDVTRARNVILTLNGLIKYLLDACKLNFSKNEVMATLLLLENLANNSKEILNMHEYANLHSLIKSTLLNISKASKNKGGLNISNGVNKSNKALNSVDEIIDLCDNGIENQKKTNEAPDTSISKPLIEEILPDKKINNTMKLVMENGEKVIVVESNKKFNPLKLTEHQREIMQRKRDDIPALYQDLSQSQDEFKKKFWTTMDKPESNNITKISSLAENLKKVNTEKNDDDQRKKNIVVTTPSPNAIKRLPFKDRITKNIKLLMRKTTDSIPVEISNNVQETTNISVNMETSFNELNTSDKNHTDKNKTDIVLNKIENITPNEHINSKLSSEIKINKVNTPERSKNTEKTKNLLTMSTERPLRAKRKPKKFAIEYEDVKKKRRGSLPNLIDLNKWVTDKNSNDKIDQNGHDDTSSIKQRDGILSTKIISSLDENDVSMELENKNKENLPTEITKTCDFNEEKTEQKNNDQIINNNKNTVKSIADTNILENTDNFENTQNDETQIQESQVNELHANIVDQDNNLTLKNSNITNNNKVEVKSTSKGKKEKQSRLVKNLAIDMVEGNPFLHKPASPRKTRRSPNSNENGKRRINNSETKHKNTKKHKVVKNNEAENDNGIDKNIADINESPLSEDFIESSQDSVISTMSVKSRRSLNSANKTQNTIRKSKTVDNELSKTPSISADLTSSVDTEPLINTPLTNSIPSTEINSQENSEELIPTLSRRSSKKRKTSMKKRNLEPTDSTINLSTTLENNKEDSKEPSSITSECTASMDTESLIKTPLTDENSIIEINSQENTDKPIQLQKQDSTNCEVSKTSNIITEEKTNEILTLSDSIASMDTEPLLNTPLTGEITPVIEINTQEGIEPGPETLELAEADTQPIDPSIENQKITGNIDQKSIDLNVTDISTGISSPFKDDVERNEVFLNNTLDISPIKTMVSKNESNTPEKSDEYIVIKLTSPVQSNGEPLNDSPEIFTNDKLSPNNSELSPPREVMTENASSPLSLKKRCQMRPNGRAAQMLSLCQPNKFQSIMNNNERVNDCEEAKKSCIGMSAKRNLQILYNMNAENSVNDNVEENFLKLQRPLPSADSSPIGPILKRKYIDIEDENTMSPASKKKRVSFHDPPVSTTVAVQKYIEVAEKSPQNSHNKRNEKPPRNNIKSPKQLDALFKQIITSNKWNEISQKDNEDCLESEPTPLIEVVNVSELNDTEPICLELINSTASIEVIALELSSSAMKDLLVKELEGKINTVGDFAKLTEVEVNRLCIKAPKIKVAKDVLANYLAEINSKNVLDDTIEVNSMDVSPTKLLVDVEMQTDEAVKAEKFIQTNECVCIDTLVQTNESSFVSTEDLISNCMKERPDFIEKISERTELQNSLKFNTILPVIQRNITCDDERKMVLNEVVSQDNSLQILEQFICDKFNSTSVIMFCSNLLKRTHQIMDK